MVFDERGHELRAIRRARRRRRRSGRLLLGVSLSVGLVTVASLLLLPGFSWRRPAQAPVEVRETPAPLPEPPTVRVHDGAIELDGVPLARTEGIDRFQRVTPLYEALMRRRQDWAIEHPGQPAPRLLLAVDTDVPAIVVKSVFQTAAFAGYPDVTFLLPDGGRLGPR
jgi:hypothetical protein